MDVLLRECRLAQGDEKKIFLEVGLYPVVKVIEGLGYLVKTSLVSKSKEVTVIRFKDADVFNG